jgi:hypothetical protein
VIESPCLTQRRREESPLHLETRNLKLETGFFPMLERLIRKAPPENLGYGTVVTVERRNRRVKIRWRNDIEVWAAYMPEDFPGIEEGQTVALGFTGGEAFIIRLVDSALPTETTLLEV